MSGKKRRSKNLMTLVSLACVTLLLIGGYLLYSSHKQKQEDEKAAKEAAEQEEEDATFTINEEAAENFTNLSIQSSEATLSFTKNGELWNLDGEPEFPTDDETLNSMVTTLASLSASKTAVEEAQDLGEFGLLQPTIIVTATRQDGSKLIFNVGDKAAVGSDYYGSLNDSTTVYVIPVATRTKFNVTREDVFYKPAAPSVTADQLREIQLSTQSNGNFHIVYDAENPYDYTGMSTYPWYSVGDNRAPINLDNMTTPSLLGDYLTYNLDHGVGYGQEAMDTYGLTNPQGMIYLRYVDATDSSKENEYVLHIGNQDENGNYYVSVNDSTNVYLMLSSELSERLAYDETTILTNYVCMVNIEKVKQLILQTSNESHTYEITSTVSTNESGNEVTSTTYNKDGAVIEDVDAFKSFYQTIISIKRTGNLTLDSTISKEPVLTVKYELTDEREVEVSFYDYNETSYAVVINENIQFTADKTEVDALIRSIQ